MDGCEANSSPPHTTTAQEKRNVFRFDRAPPRLTCGAAANHQENPHETHTSPTGHRHPLRPDNLCRGPAAGGYCDSAPPRAGLGG